MSSNIWTQCAGSSELGRLKALPWRAVEAQHIVGSRRLVDSEEEHALLESLLEESKPAIGEDARGLHYLLSTSFRYPPLRHGSRFGTRAERGIWYGSDKRETCFAEVAYYRLLFLEGSRAELGTLAVELSLFRAAIATTQGIDLCRAPFERHRAEISSPVAYAPAQELGRAMRSAGVEAFRYFSARSPGDRNYGLFSPRAFTRALPEAPEAWSCYASRAGVELVRKSHFERPCLRYERALFEIEGRLPAPAL